MNSVLLSMLLMLCLVLVIFLIVICIKLIYTIDKTNMILDDLDRKMKSVNGLFTAIDTVTDAVTTVSETIVGKVLLMIEKVFRKRK